MNVIVISFVYWDKYVIQLQLVKMLVITNQ